VSFAITRNPFVFPTGATPGIDANNPATKTLRCSIVTWGPYNSAVANQAGTFDLLSRKRGSPDIRGNTSGAVDGVIGPGVFCYGSIAYTGNTWAAGTAKSGIISSITVAALIRLRSYDGAYFAGTSSANANNGCNPFINNAGLFGCYWWGNGGDVKTTFPVAFGVPYFLIGCDNGSVWKALALNLTTGAVQTETVATTQPHLTCDGGFCHGINSSTNTIGGHNIDGLLGPLMFSDYDMSIREMIEWAKDPFRFWYPNA